jgi:hypothetical protein
VLTFACMVYMVTTGGGTPSWQGSYGAPRGPKGPPRCVGTEEGGGLVAPICQEGARIRTRWRSQDVKWCHTRKRQRCDVERGSAVRRHVGSSVRSRSYRNALEKCVKLLYGEEAMLPGELCLGTSRTRLLVKKTRRLRFRTSKRRGYRPYPT